MRSAIVTIPPYAPYIGEVLRHPSVSGVRLNTVMPTKEPLVDLLSRLKGEADATEKRLYLDLKCRQLRVKTFGVPPFTEIELTHDISVDTPVIAYFADGKVAAKVIGVEGNKLYMLDGPSKVVGPGESVNIIHPSLKVDGYFTDLDKEYIEAAKETGVKDIMLSFVEGPADVAALKELHPDSMPVAKIESPSGMDYVNNVYQGGCRLMVGRGDLFVEVQRPHQIVKCLEDVVGKDPDAIAASRIFDSLVDSYEPSCADIMDADNLLRMGYQTVMMGDHLCMQRERILNGLNLFREISRRYD